MAWWVILRPLRWLGRISIARTQRGSVIPDSVTRSSQASWAWAGIVNECELTTRSGSAWPKIFAKFQPSSSGHATGGGMSFGSPCAAPPSTHFTTVSNSAGVSDSSFLNRVTPTVRSIWKGGIECSVTRALIARAHGRACCQVMQRHRRY